MILNYLEVTVDGHFVSNRALTTYFEKGDFVSFCLFYWIMIMTKNGMIIKLLEYDNPNPI